MLKLSMYEVIVRFDDEIASLPDSKVYFSALHKFANGVGLGHANGTSSMFIKEERFNHSALQDALGDIRILGVREI